MKSQHVEDFLTHLVVNWKLAKRTQNLALNALVFLYKDIIQEPISLDMQFQRSNKARKRILSPYYLSKIRAVAS